MTFPMRARGWVAGLAALCATAPAGAEPKPAPVDIKAFRDELLVFQDGDGGTYVVRPDKDAKVFYGTGKQLYEQIVIGRSTDGDAWSVSTWAPRVAELRPGQIARKKDGTFEKTCDGKDDHGLTQLAGDKAKAVLDKSQFMTTALIRRPHLLGRDDSGVYYYIDVIAKQYGGQGHRVFVGKKGAMKELALTDVASDSGGEVFATKTGDLRLVTSGSPKVATWVRGERKSELIVLDLDVNSRLIYRDLGIYKFTGTLCDNI
jgi:hypothetical protein